MSLAELVFIVSLIIFFLLSGLWVKDKKNKHSLTFDLYRTVPLTLMPWLLILIKFLFEDQEVVLRQVTIAILVSIWGLKTTFRLRNSKKYILEKSPDKIGYLKKVIPFGIFQIIIMGPVFSVNFLPGPASLTLLDYFAIVLFLSFLAVQIHAEKQLNQFLTSVKSDNEILSSGHWVYSRHPDQLASMFQWWAIYFISCSSIYGYWSIYSPLIMFIFLKLTLDNDEKHLLNKKSEYENYLKNTDQLFPNILGLISFLSTNKILTSIASSTASSNNKFVKRSLISLFCFFYKPDLTECLIKEPKEYKSFNEFFTRKLKVDSRKIELSEKSFISPVDGRIIDFGKTSEGKLIQAKKFKYSVSSLLCDKETSNIFKKGFFVTLYLAPKDYHRIHTPFGGDIEKTQYIPGNLFSVNKSAVNMIPSLYSRNERAWLKVKTNSFSYVMVFVGASMVGSIVPFWSQTDIKDKKLLTKAWREGPTKNLKTIEKGQELGFFKLGSTVILLFPESLKFNNIVSEYKSVKFGQQLFKI